MRGQLGQVDDVFRKGAGPHDKPGTGLSRVLAARHMGGEPKASQAALHKQVELCGAVAGCGHLAEQAAGKRHIAELVPGEVVEGEVMIGVIDAARVQVVMGARQRSVLGQNEGRLRRALPHIAQVQAWQGGKRLGGVGLVLDAMQLVGRTLDIVELLGRYLLGCIGLVLFRLALIFFEGDKLAAAVVIRVDKDVAHGIFPKRRGEALAQRAHRVFVAQVIAGHLVVVQPAAHGVDGQRHAVGHARVALAQAEVGGVECRRELCARHALACHAGKLGLQQLGELACRPGACAAQLDDHIRLQQAVVHEAVHVAAQVRFENRALERGLVAAHEGVAQNLAGQDARAVAERSEDESFRDAGVVGARLHLLMHVETYDGCLKFQGVCRTGRASALTLLVDEACDELELGHEGDVAVQHDAGVCHVVMARVGVQVRLIGEVGDGRGVAAGFVSVGGVGEQRRVEACQGDLVRVGHGPAHLVEHNAIGHEVPVRAFALHFVVPAFLFENRTLVVELGEEHGVEIDAHQVHEVALVGACDRVHRLVGERERVEERLHRGFEQVDERLLYRILVAAAQNGVL